MCWWPPEEFLVFTPVLVLLHYAALCHDFPLGVVINTAQVERHATSHIVAQLALKWTGFAVGLACRSCSLQWVSIHRLLLLVSLLFLACYCATAAQDSKLQQTVNQLTTPHPPGPRWAELMRAYTGQVGL